MQKSYTEEAIAHEHFVVIVCRPDGEVFMDCLSVDTQEIVTPPEDVLSIVKDWTSDPYRDGLNLQDWIIKTIEDAECQMDISPPTAGTSLASNH
jgi:hypothetical protein